MLYRKGQWVVNQRWWLNYRIYGLAGLGIAAAGNAAQLVIEEMSNDLDALTSFVMFTYAPRMARVWGPANNQTWYELNASNMSQKVSHMYELLTLFNRFVGHFAVGDAGDMLDGVTIAEMYKIMDDYLREVAPGS